MPQVSDTWKPGFSIAASIKGIATGNYADAALNAGLAVGQIGWVVGKYKISKDGKLGPRFEGGDSLKDSFGKECVILERGIQLVTLLTLLHGSGADEGQYYQAGSDKLKLAWENLKDAAAELDSWSGDSAEAYNAQNAAQIDAAATMADLDLQIAAILAEEAETLGNAKIALTSVRAFFTVSIPVACTLRWMYGPQASLLFQLATFTAGMSVAVFTTMASMDFSLRNAKEIDLVTAEYAAVANSAVATGSDFAAPKIAPAAAPAVSEFDELDTSGSSAATSAGSVPGASVSAAIAGTGGGQTPAAPSATEPSEGAMPSIGVAPAYTVPAVSQVTSPAPGPMAASRAAPSAEAGAGKARARTAAAVADDGRAGDSQGAGAGAGDVEGAPIDTAGARTDQAQQRLR